MGEGVDEPGSNLPVHPGSNLPVHRTTQGLNLPVQFCDARLRIEELRETDSLSESASEFDVTFGRSLRSTRGPTQSASDSM